MSYSPGMRWFIICATANRTFRVSLYLNGIDGFLEQCERHLAIGKLMRAKQGYQLVGRSFPEGRT